MERTRTFSPLPLRPRPPLVESKPLDLHDVQIDRGWDCAYFPPAASDAQIATIVDEITSQLQHPAMLGRRWRGVGARARSTRR
jgi:hypothetical protein